MSRKKCNSSPFIQRQKNFNQRFAVELSVQEFPTPLNSLEIF